MPSRLGGLVSESPYGHQTAVHEGSRAAADTDVAALQRPERDQRGHSQRSQSSDSFSPVTPSRECSVTAPGDGIIQTTVQRAKVIGVNGSSISARISLWWVGVIEIEHRTVGHLVVDR